MSNIWAKNPDLFLYTKGNDVYLWKCNKTTWMPMIPQDFDVVAKITDHQALIGNDDSLIAWNEKYYEDLIAYISSRRLLVNSQGLVIAELRKFGQDGKLDVNDQLPFYIRSLDVLSLKPYNLRDKTIPSRTVRYLGGEGRAAPVEDSTVSPGSITTTSTGLPPLHDHDVKRAALEKQVAELIAANKTLTSDNTELKEVNKTLKKQATDLNDRNKALAGDVAAQTAKAASTLLKLMVVKRDKEAADKQATDLNDRNKALAEDVAAQTAKAENILLKLMVTRRDKEAAEKLATDLNDRNKALAEDVAAQTAKAANILLKLMVTRRDKEAAETKAASLQIQIDKNKKEGWMNDLSDESGSWLHAEFLQPYIHRGVSVGAGNAFRVVVVERGTSTEDDNTTNVHTSYIYRVKIIDNVDINIRRATKEYRAVKLEDLNPSKEKARFCIQGWVRLVYNGDIYVIKETLASRLVQTLLSRRC